MDTLTYSSCSTFSRCQQQYCWRYEKGLRKRDRMDSDALSIGIGFHDALDMAHKNGVESALADVRMAAESIPAIGALLRKFEETAAKVCAMVRVAHAKWPSGLATSEEVFTMPITSSDGARSRTFEYRGKMDGVTKNGTLLDWKSVSDIGKFTLARSLSYQLPGYSVGYEFLHGERITMAEFRLVTRPTIRLKGVTKQRKAEQSVESYEAECIAWLSQPGKLSTEEIIIHAGNIDGWRHWVWGVAKSILEARKHGRWLRNVDTCQNMYGSQCEYIDLCLTLAQGVEPDTNYDYEVCEKHPELQKGAQ